MAYFDDKSLDMLNNRQYMRNPIYPDDYEIRKKMIQDRLLEEEEERRKEKIIIPKKYVDAENHIHESLMAAGDACAIRDLTQALLMIRKIIKEESEYEPS